MKKVDIRIAYSGIPSACHSSVPKISTSAFSAILWGS